jgi:hypothetical protein
VSGLIPLLIASAAVFSGLGLIVCLILWMARLLPEVDDRS